jgi:hypothetical protein
MAALYEDKVDDLPDIFGMDGAGESDIMTGFDPDSISDSFKTGEYITGSAEEDIASSIEQWMGYTGTISDDEETKDLPPVDPEIIKAVTAASKKSSSRRVRGKGETEAVVDFIEEDGADENTIDRPLEKLELKQQEPKVESKVELKQEPKVELKQEPKQETILSTIEEELVPTRASNVAHPK